MRLFVFALIAAALHAQEPNEAQFPVAGGELKYLYSAGANAPLLLLLPGSMEEQVARKVFAQWKPALTALGWNCVIPIAAGVSDQTVRTVELTLGDAKKRLPKVDENRVYLVGQ